MNFFCLFFLFVLSLNLVGCAQSVKKVDYKPAMEIAFDSAPVPILFKGMELLLPVGMNVGFETEGAYFCGWPRYLVSRTVLRQAIDGKFIEQTFRDALEGQGYDVVGSLDLAYDLEDERERADYSIKANITDVQLEMCHKKGDDLMLFFATRRGTKGEFYMSVNWSVYDVLQRSVVYKTRTEGYTKRSIPNQEGLALMFNEAFEMAAHNLGADKDFHDLLVNGIKPQGWKKENPAQKKNMRPPQFDPLEEVIINTPPLSHEPFIKNIESKRGLAVMVQKFGHSSGFFISKKGYILTTADAVGDALRTRIVISGKSEKLTAEILRVDKVRNVALLKLEEIPESFKITTLPIKMEWPSVGAEVYTIGNPKDSHKFLESVSKGIISAHRKKMKLNSVRQNFIQADIEAHRSSSGGPLIDENGNIVGMMVAGKTDETGTGLGLNYFVPIAELLKALDIQLEDVF